MLSLPKDIEFLLNPNVCNDVTVIYEFSKEYKRNPEEVVEWLRSNIGELNRANIKLFKEYIGDWKDSKSSKEIVGGDETTANSSTVEGDESRQGSFDFTPETKQETDGETVSSNLEVVELEEENNNPASNLHVDNTEDNKVPEAKPTKAKSVQEKKEFYKPEECQIIVAYGNEKYRIVLDRKSEEEGWCWVEGQDGQQLEVDMTGADFVSLSFLSGK